jgi:hypothetical protein
MGCTMSDQQADLLSRRFTQAIVMLDGDEAGRHGSAAIAGRPKSTVKTVANSPIRGARKSWPDYAKCLAEADQGIRKGKPEGGAKHDDRDHSGADFRFACYSIRRGWTVAELTSGLLAEPDSKARRLGRRGSKYAEHTAGQRPLRLFKNNCALRL